MVTRRPMAANPFSYGSPVASPYFAGRAVELAALTSRMSNGINVVVTAPRRYGKTSLLGRAAGQVAAQGGAIVQANLLRVASLDALAGRLAAETYQLAGGPWRRAAQAIPEFVKRLRLRPTVSFDGTGRPQFNFAPTAGSRDSEQVIDDVYRILSELEDSPAVLMLDEFQAAVDLSPRLPELLKALADEYPKISLVLAGSRRHLMDSLVLAHGAPLYNMAERLALGPIEEPTMRQFLQDRAAAGGKSMAPPVAAAICQRAGPIPHDIQRLAYEVFDLADGTIQSNDVDAGLDRVVTHEAEGYADRFSKFAMGHRRILVALATAKVTQPQSAPFVRAVGYANPGAAGKAIRALEEDETVVRRDGVLVVADPFFRIWLARP